MQHTPPSNFDLARKEVAKSRLAIAWRCRVVNMPAEGGVDAYATRDGHTTDALLQFITCTPEQWTNPAHKLIMPAPAWERGKPLSERLDVPLVVVVLEGEMIQFRRLPSWFTAHWLADAQGYVVGKEGFRPLTGRGKSPTPTT
jgi:hypothetical protein